VNAGRAAPTAPEHILDRYRQLTAAEIVRRLPAGEPRQWLYEPMADYPQRTGKALRAALCLASCGAYGDTEEDALTVAAAIEMAHCAFLIHDDIQDGSLVRRGGPTLHRREGVPLALNTGNALALASFDVLRAGCRPFGQRLSGRVFDEFRSSIWRTLEGQALELGWRRDGLVELSIHDYLTMVLGKTCWYTTIAPLRIGALIGSRGRADLAPMSRFGLFLGAAFQITDDVLNVAGAAAAYGKEGSGDLREGKRTLMIIHALAVAGPADRRELADLLRSPDTARTDERIAWIAGLLARCGSIAFAREFARGVAAAAAAAFSDAFRPAPHPKCAEIIHDLVDYMIERTH
jgi:geranylgeranyl diphosphate synthase, type II